MAAKELSEINSIPSTYEYFYRLRYILVLGVFSVLEFGFMFANAQYITLTFFAEKYGGGDCEVSPSSEPCHLASADVAAWRGLSGAVSSSVSWIFAIVAGSISDSTGRRPFFILNTVLSALPVTSMTLHLFAGMSLWVFLYAAVVLMTFDIGGVRLAVIGDIITEPEQRAPAKGALAIGMLSVVLVVLPFTAFVPARPAILISCVAVAAKTAYVMLVFPETVPLRADSTVEGCGCGFRGPIAALRVMARDSVIFRMLLVIVFTSFQGGGFGAVLPSFLTGDMGMTRPVVIGLFCAGACSVALWFGLLRAVVPRYGEAAVLRASLSAAVVCPACLAFCSEVWQVFVVFVLLLGPVIIQAPIISAIKSNLVADNERGLIQGVLVGISNVASGLSMAVFGLLYQYEAGGSAAASGQNIARRPLLGVACVGACALALACSLPQRLQYPQHAKSEPGEPLLSESAGA